MILFGPGGEIQNAEVTIPIFDYKHMIDLSRTRSHFIAGYPLDVVVCIELAKTCT